MYGIIIIKASKIYSYNLFKIIIFCNLIFILKNINKFNGCKTFNT